MEGKVYVRQISENYMESYYFKTLADEFCEYIIKFFIFYPILAMISYKVSDNGAYDPSGLLVLLPIFIMTYIRMRIANRGKSVLLILLTVVTFGFLFKIFTGYYVNTLFLVPWTIDALRKNDGKQRVTFKQSTIKVGEIALSIELLGAYVFNIDIIKVPIVIIAILVGLGSILYINNVRTRRLFIEDGIRKTAVNISKDYTRNSLIIIVISAITAIIILFYSTGIFKLASNITDGLASLITSSTINTVDGFMGNDQQQVAEEEPVQQDMPKIPDRNINPIVRAIIKVITVILKILWFLVKVLFICAIFVGIYMWINYILIKLKQSKDVDKIEFAFNEDNSIESIKKKFQGFKNNLKEMMPVENRIKIRKLYRQRILKYRKQKVIVTDVFTAGEIEREIQAKTNDNIDQITSIYEKARYSKEDITEEEVSRLRRGD